VSEERPSSGFSMVTHTYVLTAPTMSLICFILSALTLSNGTDGKDPSSAQAHARPSWLLATRN
jgi:hypothetical protein